MENYEINKYLQDFKKRLDELVVAINLSKLNDELEEYDKMMNEPSFWNNTENSKNVLKKVKIIKNKIELYHTNNNLIEELELYFDMHKSNEDNLEKEIEDIIVKIENSLSAFENEILLSKEYDSCDAIIDMHPGAGGTESQDWCSMLFRMYKMYCERNNFTYEVLDYQDGEEAGIKSVTFIVHGINAYGYLKGEQGVHRLVRISPFDSNARRHTSFCAVTIVPQVENDINIEINPDDIRIDTYRASGAGGQHVNTTDSAIRITHLKTGIVVTCQNERSQLQNKEKAFQVLKSKLYQLELEEQNKKIKDISGEISNNGFGSQIRSYVFHPYSMIKDHRTNFEEFNVDKVMDGDLDNFINAYLKSNYNMR